MNLRLSLGTMALGAVVLAPLAASAQAYPAANSFVQRVADVDDGYRHHDRVTGRINSIDGSDIRLRDGLLIHLRHGTVINPTGANLHPGERITVEGWRDRADGALNARVVNVDWHRDHDGDIDHR
jgi:hypothetical protein